ncbi:MAG: alpha,alpha-trehalase TreF [Steroidobacteraceae bacterium]
MRRAAGLLLSLLALPAEAGAEAAVAPPTPSELYPGLFERIQLEQVFDDGKAFVDAVPLEPAAEIMEEYESARGSPDFDLREFVTSRFAVAAPAASAFDAAPDMSVTEHIDALWPILTREPDTAVPGSSLLPLPHRYVVPGGRFQEIYYWDSYFTMLGLAESGRHELVADMVRNFAFLIDRYGHVPNGNRSYYLSRSQPPFFSLMVELLAAREGSDAYRRFLPQLRREHDFWMEGAESLAPGKAHRRVVRLPDGTLFNRYWDDRDTPREESYRNDVETARASGRPPAEVYRNLRAAAESGWDFSSRWLRDGSTLATIRTVELIPVDLNSLLYSLEQTLARAYRIAVRPDEAARFTKLAHDRRRAIHRFLWNGRRGLFEDYSWRDGGRTGHVTAATLYPLFTGVATAAQASDVMKVVERDLVAPDGLATTTERTGQQWDAPNGWAPLQWIAIEGLNRYGHRQLARRIAHRWIRENVAYYEAHGKLVEKYDVSGNAAARGGEYPLQDGFGWTNGVLRRLLAVYGDVREGLPAREAAAGRVLLAVFAHPDDEMTVAPILARYARTGVRVYLAVATDGRRGVAAHAGTAAGESLATLRTGEAACAVRALGIEAPILLGFGDGDLGAIVSPPGRDLDRLARDVRRILDDIKPDAVLTWGPGGGYGHPDHRLVADVVLQVVAERGGPALYSPGWTASDIAESGMDLMSYPVDERLITMQVGFSAADAESARAALRCHESQFTPAAIQQASDGLERVWDGHIALQPWFGAPGGTDLFTIGATP